MNWTLLFAYGPFIVFVLTCFFFVRQLRLSLRSQIAWSIWLLLSFSKFFFFMLFGVNSLCPELPSFVIWGWDWMYSGAMILFVLSVACPFRFRSKKWLFPLLAWGMSAWGLWNGARVPDVHRIDLSFRNLPASLDGYRIVQLADIHASSAARRWRTQALVDIANSLNADLIVLTGDNSDGKLSWSHDFLEPIRDLRARDGVFACTGNHEYYFDYFDWKTNFYSQVTNVRFLDNECVFPHAGMAIAGVPDDAGFNKGLVEPPDVRQAFASATNGEFRILLHHQPKYAMSTFREVGVDLQLSGHTHGGICPGLRWFVEKMNAGYSRGIYRFGESVLYVSPGSGQWAGFPMRFFNDSEVTLITLGCQH